MTTPTTPNPSNIPHTPNPAALAAARDAERARVKLVRQRRRLRNGASLTSHIDTDTAVALTKIARPDAGNTK